MVDYRRWDNIEVSDDEDDTHPNIDTPSLFRWRHEARVQREEEMKQAKLYLEQKRAELENKKKSVEEQKQKPAGNKDVEKLESEVQKMALELEKQQKVMEQKERLTPLNVDTLSKDGFSKTIINAEPKEEKSMTEEERAESLKEFTTKNETLLKQYGLLRKYDDSRKFLMEHPHLACENTANYLVIWCINLTLEEKMELMNHVSHQCIAMQFLMELSKQLKIDPRACIGSFFTKIAHAENVEYKQAFDAELEMFRDRIKRRAEQKIYEAEQEQAELDKQERIKNSPGGLDYMEVLESLPEELRTCFETQNIPLLKKTIEKMPEEDARYHMRRCIDSGLWVPDAGDLKVKSMEDTENPPEEVPTSEEDKVSETVD